MKSNNASSSGLAQVNFFAAQAQADSDQALDLYIKHVEDLLFQAKQARSLKGDTRLHRLALVATCSKRMLPVRQLVEMEKTARAFGA